MTLGSWGWMQGNSRKLLFLLGVLVLLQCGLRFRFESMSKSLSHEEAALGQL